MIYFDILHLIFCNSHRVGDDQKAFFYTVAEYSTCKYLGNYLNGKHNLDIQHGTNKLARKKVMSNHI